MIEALFVAAVVVVAAVILGRNLLSEMRPVVGLVSSAAERQIRLGVGDVRGDIAVLTARVIELEKSQRALVAVLREVVQETAGDVLDNDQGIPIRRVRGVRAALWRMEIESAKEHASGE